jgi:hypothetical protein
MSSSQPAKGGEGSAFARPLCLEFVHEGLKIFRKFPRRRNPRRAEMQASSGCLGKVVGRPDGRAGLHPNLKYPVMNPADALQQSVRPRDDSCGNSRLRSRPSHRRRLPLPYHHLPGPRSGVRVPPQSPLTTTGGSTWRWYLFCCASFYREGEK